jgi:hypothetical protein
MTTQREPETLETKEPKTSYTPEEVATLVAQAKTLGAAGVQSIKDKEVAKLNQKVTELAAYADFASLDEDSKATAADIAQIKTVNIDNLIKHGVIPETAKRRLALQRTISDFWDEVEAIRQEQALMSPGSTVNQLLKELPGKVLETVIPDTSVPAGKVSASAPLSWEQAQRIKNINEFSDAEYKRLTGAQ